MNTFTLNTVLDSIKSDVQDILRNLSQDEINDLTPSDVCDLLDENSYFAPEVIYYADAWEIVAGSSFNDYSAECLDFSTCESSLDCIMQEANALVNDAYYSEREAIAADVLEGLQSEPNNKDNFIIEYLEKDTTQYMYFFADSEDHAIEQFNDFFKDYSGEIKLVHCSYIVG